MTKQLVPYWLAFFWMLLQLLFPSVSLALTEFKCSEDPHKSKNVGQTSMFSTLHRLLQNKHINYNGILFSLEFFPSNAIGTSG